MSDRAAQPAAIRPPLQDRAQSSSAEPFVQSPAPEYRRARDGHEYTRVEFEHWYSLHRVDLMWDEATPTGAASRSDHQAFPGETTNAETETTTLHAETGGNTSAPADSAEQPVCSMRAESAEQPVHESAADIRARPLVPGHGGKSACKKQRELRTWCLAQHPVVYDVDLTKIWPWQDLLRSLAPALLESILDNSSVVSFTFRLLRHTADHNYLRVDPGEKHVFELRRADGVAMQMHFHKKGNMDAPTVIMPSVSRPSAPPDVLHSSAAQPASEHRPLLWSEFQNNLSRINDHRNKIGKNEMQMALAAIMTTYFDTDPGAVSITSGEAFDWRSWLTTTHWNREIVGSGIAMALAVRTAQHETPQLAFVRTDDSYVLFSPAARHPLETFPHWSRSPWSRLPTASASTAWMQLRVQP